MPILLNCTEDGLDADINTDVDLKEQFWKWSTMGQIHFDNYNNAKKKNL